MASRPHRRRRLVPLAGLAAGLSLALFAVGVANAGAGDPASIHVTSTGGLSVSASGTWNWPEMATAEKLSYAGFALDWGDVTSGNAVPRPGGLYHIGDGTAATNVVLQPTSPAQGSKGSWGPVSHTYKAAGQYTVCVLIYDLGEVKPFKDTGYHSLRAGGPDRNTDNSVEQNGDVMSNCQTISVTVPTPTPTATATATATPTSSVAGATGTPMATSTPTGAESVGGVTFAPVTTPPPTSESSSSNSSDSTPLLIALGLAFLLTVLIYTGMPARNRR